MPTVDCPVCKGQGNWYGETCGCCKGSGKMYLAEDQYKRRVHDLAMNVDGRIKAQSTRCIWKGEELEIALKAETPTRAQNLLRMKGYRRTIAAIANIRHKAKRRPGLTENR